MAPNDSTPEPRLQGESTAKLYHYLLVFACADYAALPQGIGRRRGNPCERRGRFQLSSGYPRSSRFETEGGVGI